MYRHDSDSHRGGEVGGVDDAVVVHQIHRQTRGQDMTGEERRG